MKPCSKPVRKWGGKEKKKKNTDRWDGQVYRVKQPLTSVIWALLAESEERDRGRIFREDGWEACTSEQNLSVTELAGNANIDIRLKPRLVMVTHIRMSHQREYMTQHEWVNFSTGHAFSFLIYLLKQVSPLETVCFFRRQSAKRVQNLNMCCTTRWHWKKLLKKSCVTLSKAPQQLLMDFAVRLF